MERSKLAHTLALCRRAGVLKMGYDLVKESVHKGNAQLVLFAQDMSKKTAEDIRFVAGRAHVNCMELPLTMDELWYFVGKRIGVAAVTDRGLADKLKAYMDTGGVSEDDG